MNLPLIFNRDNGAENRIWVHTVPEGELPNPEAGIVQVQDRTANDSIVSSFYDEKRKLGDRFPGLYYGREHHLYIPAESSEALGWGKEMENRDNGVWVLVELTDVGLEAIRNKRFKYTSFCADPSDVQRLDGNRVRVMKLESVGFTNLPNGKGLLMPISNRSAGPGNGAPSGNPSKAIQHRAAQRLAQLAEHEQRASGGSLASCFLRVTNREKSLCDLANGRPVPAGVKAGAREVLEDAAEFAGRTILRLAQSRKMPGLSGNISYIKNRFPRLTRMENRQAGWDGLADLEPVARRAYMDAVQRPRSDAQPESRWNGFFGMLDTLKLEFPDLGYEGYWQRMKELYPATFLKFVLSFDDQEGSSDMLAPPPKTEQERYQEKRARISQAASTEWQRYGRNGRGTEQLAQDTVNEALAAL